MTRNRLKTATTGALGFLIAGAWLFIRCSLPLTGGTSTTDNPKVTGVIMGSDARPACAARVLLLPETFDPQRDTGTLVADTTDEQGRFSLLAPHQGMFTIQAVSLVDRTSLLIQGIDVKADDDSVVIAGDTLKPSGTVVVAMPEGVDRANGYLYIPGTTVYAWLADAGARVTLYPVPATTVRAVCYATKNDPVPAVLRYNVSVAPGSTARVDLPSWKYATRLTLNTTGTGAGVAREVIGFPVLVRLTAADFPFDLAQASGNDIRFCKENGSPLAHEIEAWDAAAGRAVLWVSVDTVFGNDSTQSLVMYWGNSGAAAASNPSAVFDTAKGFAGVWHMAKSAGALVPDATANQNAGTTTATGPVSGAIGMAQSFDGSTSLVRVAGPATDRLNFLENSEFSLSAWVRTNVLDSMFHGIVYKSNFQYGLQMRPNNRWEFVTFSDQSRWEMSRAPVADQSWHFLAGIRSGTRQFLFVDGVCVDSSPVFQPSALSRAENQPLEIGHCPDGGDDPDRYFSGAIDEVQIAGRARDADWIKLCFMNQKEQDALVRWQRKGDALR